MNAEAMNNTLSMTNVVSDIRGSVQKVMDYPIFPSSHITVASLLVLVLLVALVIVAEQAVRRYFVTRLLRRTHLEPGMQFAVARVIGYAFLGLGFYISLQMVGVNLNSLAFIAGAVGVGLGFGLQNVISNFISGLIILAERPIAIGDRVEIGDVAGQVRTISLRSTTIITNDNIAIIVPNADFITQKVTNWSYIDPRVRFRIPFGVAYGTDLPKLQKLMMAAAAEHPRALREPEPELFFVGLGDSSLNFELAVWSSVATTSPRRFRSELFFAVENKLRESGIEMPFPQRDLHVRSIAEGLIPKPEDRSPKEGRNPKAEGAALAASGQAPE